MDIKIDFVITWVNGNDIDWVKKRNKYLHEKKNCDVTNSRYRDWGLLKYWFRSVDKYANWVNNIFLITDNQIPEWLDINNNKIKIINHCDILFEKYLPTFNSNAIEMGIENIKELSEFFVYFNDDMFINDYVFKSDFFVNQLPCDAALLSPIIPKEKNGFYKALANTVYILNKNFEIHNSVKNNISKWFSAKYGIDIFRNLFLSRANNFCGFYNSHIPNSYLKSIFSKAIHLDEEMYNINISSKFRDNNTNFIHWIAQYYQFATGKFYPRSKKIGKYFSIENSLDKLQEELLNHKHKLICINDNCDDKCYIELKKHLINIFDTIYPKKSTFEKEI